MVTADPSPEPAEPSAGPPPVGGFDAIAARLREFEARFEQPARGPATAPAPTPRPDPTPEQEQEQEQVSERAPEPQSAPTPSIVAVTPDAPAVSGVAATGVTRVRHRRAPAPAVPFDLIGLGAAWVGLITVVVVLLLR